MESQSLPKCTSGVGGMGNLTLRPQRDRLSEIRLETDTFARGARLGMRMLAHALRTAWYNVGALRGAGSFVNYV